MPDRTASMMSRETPGRTPEDALPIASHFLGAGVRLGRGLGPAARRDEGRGGPGGRTCTAACAACQRRGADLPSRGRRPKQPGDGTGLRPRRPDSLRCRVGQDRAGLDSRPGRGEVQARSPGDVPGADRTGARRRDQRPGRLFRRPGGVAGGGRARASCAAWRRGFANQASMSRSH